MSINKKKRKISFEEKDDSEKYKLIKETHKDWKHYLIHDNGGRPFCVYISPENKIDIYKVNKNNTFTENDYAKIYTYTEFVMSFKPKKTFVGKSPKNKMTEFSSGYGQYFDGNSILLYLGNSKYVFIGSSIFSFKTNKEIVKFVSPVGNSDVPYPYAIDNEDNYYFLIENGIMKIKDKIETYDPYNYYYKILKKITESENVEYICIKNEKFNITSNPNPKENYEDLIKRIGKPIYIKKKDNKNKKIITKNEYIKLLTDYNNKIGLSPIIDIKIIQERIW